MRSIPSMLRRKFLYGVALAPAGLTVAQQNSAPGQYQPVQLAPDHGGIVHWPVDDLRKAHTTLAAAAANGQTTPVARDLLELPTMRTHAFSFLCRYPVPNREPRAEYHAGCTDVYFIEAGSATMTIGGELENREPVANEPGEFQAKSVTGGKNFHVEAGDILNIPPSTPHWTHPDPGGVSYMMVKINVGMYPWSMVAGYRNPSDPKLAIPVAPDQGGIVYWSADDLKKAHTLLTDAAAKGQPAPRDLVETPVTHTHFYDFVSRYPVPNREPRAEYHEGVTDVYFIAAGSATMTIGGDLENPQQSAKMPGEYQGSSVRGGKTFRVQAGDVINIPPATAHLTHPDPGGISYILLKVNVGLYPWNIIAGQPRAPR
jgi:mannose-6-phosphate isomerase-like protein (cupin superfamily)